MKNINTILLIGIGVILALIGIYFAFIKEDKKKDESAELLKQIN